MRFAFFTLLLAFLAVSVLAVAPLQKAVIVSYDDNTPDHVIAEAKSAIKAAGGVITHEYKLIKAFAAKASAKALETVSVWGTEYNAVVEEDAMVSINGGH